jgi:hypothetical protein
LKNVIHSFLFCISGAVAQSFDVVFHNSSGIVFTQSLQISQVTNVSELVGTSAGSPLFRLVVDLESNSILKVSSDHQSIHKYNLCFLFLGRGIYRHSIYS